MAEYENSETLGDERPDDLFSRESLERAFELWGREGSVSVKRICATNFRAFRELRLEPGSLTALVGANAAGKSSVIDLFTFLSDCLSLSLYTALERRGGLRAVRHTAPGGRPRNVSLSIELDFGNGYGGSYAFSINAQRGGTYTVADERCRTWGSTQEIESLTLRRGKVVEMPSYLQMGDVDDAALALPVAGAIPGLSPVLGALRNLRSYSIVPDKLREFQDSEEGQRLSFDGANAASVLRRLDAEDRSDLTEMLAYVVPGSSMLRPLAGEINSPLSSPRSRNGDVAASRRSRCRTVLSVFWGCY